MTAFVKAGQLSRRIEHRDPYDFVLHDLKHMENFVGQGRDSYEAQVGLLSALGSERCARHHPSASARTGPCTAAHRVESLFY